MNPHKGKSVFVHKCLYIQFACIMLVRLSITLKNNTHFYCTNLRGLLIFAGFISLISASFWRRGTRRGPWCCSQKTKQGAERGHGLLQVAQKPPESHRRSQRDPFHMSPYMQNTEFQYASHLPGASVALCVHIDYNSEEILSHTIDHVATELTHLHMKIKRHVHKRCLVASRKPFTEWQNTINDCDNHGGLEFCFVFIFFFFICLIFKLEVHRPHNRLGSRGAGAPHLLLQSRRLGKPDQPAFLRRGGDVRVQTLGYELGPRSADCRPGTSNSYVSVQGCKDRFGFFLINF